MGIHCYCNMQISFMFSHQTVKKTWEYIGYTWMTWWLLGYYFLLQYHANLYFIMQYRIGVSNPIRSTHQFFYFITDFCSVLNVSEFCLSYQQVIVTFSRSSAATDEMKWTWGHGQWSQCWSSSSLSTLVSCLMIHIC